MARPASTEPTDGELEILNVLWDAGPSGLGTICKTIRRERSVATTTVATMLKIMLEKKLVERSRGAKGYVWSDGISQKKTATGLLRKVLDSAFDGSAKRLVAHLLDDDTLSNTDRAEVRKLLETSKKQTKRDKGDKS
jgi:BlaI family penicillinase repressor